MSFFILNPHNSRVHANLTVNFLYTNVYIMLIKEKMLERLFTSKTRARILKTLIFNPDRQFHLRELSREIKITPIYVKKELQNLQGLNLVLTSKKGNLSLFQINKQASIFAELKSMFMKTEYFGVKKHKNNKIMMQKTLLFFTAIFISLVLMPTSSPTEEVSGLGIEILNTQPYPAINGNWIVRVETTGTADLTIKPINGTEFGRDLEFLEIRCGNQTLNYEWINSSVFIPDYSCPETGYEISKVMTVGKHALKFKFGDDVEYS